MADPTIGGRSAIEVEHTGVLVARRDVPAVCDVEGRGRLKEMSVEIDHETTADNAVADRIGDGIVGGETAFLEAMPHSPVRVAVDGEDGTGRFVGEVAAGVLNTGGERLAHGRFGKALDLTRMTRKAGVFCAARFGCTLRNRVLAVDVADAPN